MQVSEGECEGCVFGGREGGRDGIYGVGRGVWIKRLLSPCRLAGFENTLLGYKTRLYKLLKEHLNAIDVIMFGKMTLPLSWSPRPPFLPSPPSFSLHSHLSFPLPSLPLLPSHSFPPPPPPPPLLNAQPVYRSSRV